MATFERAAELGNTNALTNLGSCYEMGLGCDVDVPKALRAYEQAAAKNHREATKYRDALKAKIAPGEVAPL